MAKSKDLVGVVEQVLSRSPSITRVVLTNLKRGHKGGTEGVKVFPNSLPNCAEVRVFGNSGEHKLFAYTKEPGAVSGVRGVLEAASFVVLG
jgi:hypothetical protein